RGAALARPPGAPRVRRLPGAAGKDDRPLANVAAAAAGVQPRAAVRGEGPKQGGEGAAGGVEAQSGGCGGAAESGAAAGEGQAARWRTMSGYAGASRLD